MPPGAHDASEPARAPSAEGSDGLLVVISGPSGVGKTTITRAVVGTVEGAVLSVSVTTRPPSPTDREGIDYFFVERPVFDDMIAAGDLLEWAEVFGRRYGTPAAWVSQRLAEGRVVVLEIDVQGARQVRANRRDALGVFILPPDEEALLERLRGRGRDDAQTIKRRFAEAQREVAEARASGVYDTFVVNRDLDEAIAQTLAAIRARLPAPGGG